MAIDYGSKRVGIAVTDRLRLIAGGLDTVHSKDLVDYLVKYLAAEPVDVIVVGEPKTLQNKQSDSARFIEPFVKHLRKKFPGVDVVRFDERFTSAMARQTIIDAGARKKDRMDKSLVDKVSAVIILQDYMRSIGI